MTFTYNKLQLVNHETIYEKNNCYNYDIIDNICRTGQLSPHRIKDLVVDQSASKDTKLQKDSSKC